MKEDKDMYMVVVERICLVVLMHLWYFDDTQAFRTHA